MSFPKSKLTEYGKTKLTARDDDTGKMNIEKRQKLFTKYITDIVNLYIDMAVLYCVDANQNKIM